MDEQAAEAAREMPRYRCHREVWALKIAGIEYSGLKVNNVNTYSATITPAEPGYALFEVDAEYIRKHNPQVGGYHVVYKDGYPPSFLPAETFEEGYTLIK